MTSFFFDMSAITASGRTARVGRAAERASHILFKALEARNAAMQDVGGGTDMPAPRAAPRTRRSARKPASSDDGDSDGGDGPAFTISTSPTDGMVVGAATLSTAFMLLAQYGGRAIVPIETVCADYFAPLTLPNLRRKIAAGDIALPLVRMEAASVKAAQGIYLADLASYIDLRRAAAVKECAQLAE
jgi:hypothetical protein